MDLAFSKLKDEALRNPFPFYLRMENQMLEKDLLHIIKGCIKGKSRSQKALFKRFFGYGMSIALRYSRSEEDAKEVLNDSFLKVFRGLERFDKTQAFKPWFRQLVIHTAIDRFRAQKKDAVLIRPMHENQEWASEQDFSENIFGQEDVLVLLQRLPDAYRTVFNLYVMEGYKHHEIASMLGIREGTSKSNLARAKKKLKEWLGPIYQSKKDKKQIIHG